MKNLLIATLLLTRFALSSSFAGDAAQSPDLPNLPRVLIIGDSISIGYTPYVQQMLKGRAVVTHNSGNAGPTIRGTANIEHWLGATKWNVIHFNWGLWDMYGWEYAKEDRSPSMYEKRLEGLVVRLEKTGAKLIWGTTTPVCPEPEVGMLERFKSEIKIAPATEQLYLDAALRVMIKHKIQVNDLHALMSLELGKYALAPNNVHYTKEGYEKLGRRVADTIEESIRGELQHCPESARITASPGDTTYFIDPVKGDDSNPLGKPWKSFQKINALKLAPGDTVVIAPGRQEETFKPSGEGTLQKPIRIRFLPGVHVIGSQQVIRLPMFVSNSMGSEEPKPIGILLQNMRHVRIEGGGVEGPGKTTILYDGRMVEVFNDHSEDVIYTGLVFDLKRPTVSEFRVLKAGANDAVIQVAEGSDYAVENGKFIWRGDWGSSGWAAQEAISEEGRSWRIKESPLGWNGKGQSDATATDLGGRKVRLDYGTKEPGLLQSHQYQFRNAVRDRVGVHNARSKDIVFRDCDFYALTGMGFVSQFTENITYQRLNVAPPKGTLRTCTAWADIFQFSNCKGDILVESCRLSGMQDDAINCHGTHLRIIGKIGENQLLMRFMHRETYGFAAFQPGDEVAVISHSNLREYDGNPRRKVTAVEKKSDKEWLLTLDGPAPTFEKDDVLDNITWYPNLTARNNHISMDPVRGFLLTTRGKVVVEGNTFHRCAMAAILIEDDAEFWFESGPVRDMLIRDNTFTGCGISINPHTKSSKSGEPVHENIRIVDNVFDGADVSAKNVKGLTVAGNRSTQGPLQVKLAPSCTETKVEGNGTVAGCLAGGAMAKDAPDELVLNGNDWTVAAFEPGQGASLKAFAGGYPARDAVTSIVPGDVHWDLERAGKLPPLFYGENSREQNIGWVWKKEWWYRKHFSVPAEWQGRGVRLQFGGVDYDCAAWLNGQPLGRHEGAFLPFEFEVSKDLRFGAENTLTVHVHEIPPDVLKGKRPVYSKCESNTGWDFSAKIISMGIWKDVKMVVSDGATLANPMVFPKLSPPYDRADLLTKVEVRASSPRNIELRYRVSPLDGGAPAVVASKTVDAGTAPRQIALTIALPKPELWWPNGYGAQPLYKLEISVCEPGGARALHNVRTVFGVRDLKMLSNPMAEGFDDYFDYGKGKAVKMPDPMPDLRYLIQINGRKIFARGSNWVPADVLPGRPDRSFYEHLVRSAAEANFNLLRLWGGGVFETPDFYELCDRHGILLFQEFFCGGSRLRPPETDEGLAVAARETRELLPLMVNHPSIVRYCGGNEMYLDQNNSRQMAQLRAICNEVDPTRPFHDPDPVLVTQRHGEYDYQYPRHYFMYGRGEFRFSGPLNPCEWTEYGVGGLSAVETLKAIIPPDALWPLDNGNPVWRYHKGFKAAITDEQWAGLDGCESLFGVNLPDLDTVVRCNQYMQAEGLRYACQAMRRFRWHRSACATWSYNEPWPNAAQGCVLDYFGRRKAGYYAMKQAYAPVDVMATYETLQVENPGSWAPGFKLWGRSTRFPVELWAVNDHAESLAGFRCRCRIFDLQGKVWVDKTIAAEVPAEGCLKLGGIDWIPPFAMNGNMALLWLELSNPAGKVVARNFYPFGVALPGATLPGPLARMLKAPQTTLAASVSGLTVGKNGEKYFALEIKNAGAAPALVVSIDEPAAAETLANTYPASRNHSWFENNYFLVPPGETRSISVSLPAGISTPLRVKAWNSDAVEAAFPSTTK